MRAKQIVALGGAIMTVAMAVPGTGYATLVPRTVFVEEFG